MSRQEQMQQMPWLQPGIDRLNRLLQGGRLPHAMLLNARLGDGAELLAMEMVTTLLCESPRMGYACKHCKSCKLMQAGSHPDFTRIDPEGASKTVRIESIREMVVRFGKTPQIGARKVALIVRADTMTRAAANALLKTLEEPPGQSVLILQNEGQRPLLPTVRSRCQPLIVQRPTSEETAAWLKTRDLAIRGDESWLDMLRREPLKIEAFLRDNRQQDWDRFLSLMQGLGEGKVNPVVAAKGLEKSTLELDDQLNWIESAIHRRNSQIALQGEPLPQRLPELQQQLMQIRRELAPGVTTNRVLLQEHLFTLWVQFHRLQSA